MPFRGDTPTSPGKGFALATLFLTIADQTNPPPSQVRYYSHTEQVPLNLNLTGQLCYDLLENPSLLHLCYQGHCDLGRERRIVDMCVALDHLD